MAEWLGKGKGYQQTDRDFRRGISIYKWILNAQLRERMRTDGVPVWKKDLPPVEATDQSDSGLAALVEWETSITTRECSNRSAQLCVDQLAMVEHFEYVFERIKERGPHWKDLLVNVTSVASTFVHYACRVCLASFKYVLVHLPKWRQLMKWVSVTKFEKNCLINNDSDHNVIYVDR